MNGFFMCAALLLIPLTSTPAISAENPAGQVLKQLYRCPMHPTVRQERSGECPICHMRLEKVPKSSKEGRRIKFYRHPMDPKIHSGVPAKDSMGMDYIPVYEDEGTASGSKLGDHAPIALTPQQTRLSGTASVAVTRTNIDRLIRVPGRVLGGRQISFQIFEQDLAEITAGLEFEAEAPALPGERLSGKITSVESILDPMTRTARANGILSGERSLRTESSVSGRIHVRKKQVLAVPEAAVLNTGERTLTFVSDGQGGFTPREVRVGMRGDGLVEIREGLQDGEKVSAGPNFLIDSESRIQGSYDSQDH